VAGVPPAAPVAGAVAAPAPLAPTLKKKAARKASAKKPNKRIPREDLEELEDLPGADDLPGLDESEEIIIPKKPGRPPKIIKKNIVTKVGVVDAPSNFDRAHDTDQIYVMELTYDNPVMFKKILGVFKGNLAEQIRVQFTRTEIKFYAANPSMGNKTYVKVLGHQMNLYYCAYDTLEIGLDVERVKKIFDTFDTENSKVQMVIRQRYQQERIKIMTANDEMNDHGEFEVDLMRMDPYDWSIEQELAQESQYPISFTIPFKYFKKRVAQFKTLTDVLSIEKEKSLPLRFSTIFTGGGARYDLYFKNGDTIALHCDILPNEIFSTTIHIDYIKNFSGSLVSENLQISADRTRNLIVTAGLDHDLGDKKKPILHTEKAVVKLVVDIVREGHRP
jgi:hypothetical protein